MGIQEKEFVAERAYFVNVSKVFQIQRFVKTQCGRRQFLSCTILIEFFADENEKKIEKLQSKGIEWVVFHLRKNLT